MNAKPTELPGVLVIEPRVFTDRRGHFFEAWNGKSFEEAGIKETFAQDNVSVSKANVLRGLHYQIAPAAQGKLVRCLAGEIYDVAVDLRVGSPTFKRHVGIRLSEKNHLALWIPVGFAHGFFVVAGPAVVHYKASSPYAPALERGLRYDDPELGIAWPLFGEKPVLNERDAAFPVIADVKQENLFWF